MFGNSAAITTLQLENKQLRLELDRLAKLVAELSANALTHETLELALAESVGAAVEERLSDIDFAAEVESAVENALDRATISVRF